MFPEHGYPDRTVHISALTTRHGVLRATCILSACTRYRYELRYVWESGLPTVGFVLLNPSTATHEVLDATVRKCLRYARLWGCGHLWIGNCFAWRSRDPADLKRSPDPVGPRNDEHLRRLVRGSQRVVCAWGVHATLHDRAAQVQRLVREAGAEPLVLRLTKDGHPGHPLYIPDGEHPVPWKALA